jgi:hypothetical protein
MIGAYTLFRQHQRQVRLEKKIDAIAKAVGVVWPGPVRGSRNGARRILKKLSSSSRKEISLELKRRMKKRMERLKSRKFWLTIVGALIPVINEEFNLHLDANTVLAMIGLFGVAIAGFAHVDGKKAAAQTLSGRNGGSSDAQHGVDTGPAV